MGVVSLSSVTGAWALAAPSNGTEGISSQAPEPVTPPASPVSYRAPDADPRGEDDREAGDRALARKPTKPEKSAPAPQRHVIAALEEDLPITASPGGNRLIGEMPAVSPYLGTPHVAWVMELTNDGRFGRVTVPYSAEGHTGWISLQGLDLRRIAYSVHADLSEHEVVVKRFDETVLRVPAATGAADSPTPPGRYFVVDRVPIPEGGSFGTYAFGLSGIQPNLPAGWDGGNQLAIHGTSDPGSIGTSASAGCLRVSEDSLDRLIPLLDLGTPVIISP